MQTQSVSDPGPQQHEHDADEGYTAFLAGIRESVANVTGPVFTTDAEGLLQVFLDALPAERRQHYTCNACRRFVERFGGLVTVGASGEVVPIAWVKFAQRFFAPARDALYSVVARAKVTGVFLCSEPTWGLPKNRSVKPPFEWHHMAATSPAVYRDRLKTAEQAMAEKREEYAMLCRSFGDFTPEHVAKALALLTSGTFYRSEKCIGVAKWLHDLHVVRAATKNAKLREALTWRAVASAPTGYCHVRSGMIGTLLEDIAADLPVADIQRKFAEKMAPSQYQRAQSAPSAGNIAQAEKVIAELNAAGSLGRRYARIEDIPSFVWRPQIQKGASEPAGVFASVMPKGKANAAPTPLDIPAQTMTWDKFRRTVLPNATAIEMMTPASPDRFMALVTAANPEAPPVLQWDREDKRNPMSWYYASGIDAEIKRRVRQAGGAYENCDIRASLIWNNRNDLDLHVVTPRGEEIVYYQKRSSCGGWLDVDMNVRGETDVPVENVRWTRGTARAGHYRVFVQNYGFHEWARTPTPFRVELEVNGDVFHYDGVASPRGQTGPGSNIIVAEFNYSPGVRLGAPPPLLRAASAGNVNGWNVTANQWAPVTGIVESPNLWGEPAMRQHGEHVFFLIDSCRDTQSGVGRGLFVETLHGDYRPIRATLEAYLATAPIAEQESATACGVGLANGSPGWDQVLRVTTADGARATYKLDRWD